MPFPLNRPRRLRQSAAMRRLVAETRIHPNQLILPAFIKEGVSEPVAIESMPGVVQHTSDTLKRAAAEAASGGDGGSGDGRVHGREGRWYSRQRKGPTKVAPLSVQSRE